jgi:hypothetical protein
MEVRFEALRALGARPARPGRLLPDATLTPA